MRLFWIITAIVLGAVHACPLHAQTPSVFSHAQINVPFEVRRTGTWVEIIETREAWHAFYVANAKVYLGPNSERLTPPEFDFAAYTIVAGGLGEGGSGRSLMIQSVQASDSSTVVSALVLRATGACSTLDWITYPTVVILIPKPHGNLHVSSREASFDCNRVAR